MDHYLIRFIVFGTTAALILHYSSRAVGVRLISKAFGIGVAACGLLTLGQVVRNDRITYPFLPWRMYSSPAPPPVYSQWVSLDSGGRIYPFDLMAPHEPRVLAYRLDQLLTACKCGDGDPTADAFISALLGAHERATGEAPSAVAIEVVRVQPVASGDGRVVRYIWRRSSQTAR
jgi:hypothetical protein